MPPKESWVKVVVTILDVLEGKSLGVGAWWVSDPAKPIT